MKFAFAGIDFLGGVFEALIEAGWTPVKLFTRACDGIYDHNEVVVARAVQRGSRSSSQRSTRATSTRYTLRTGGIGLWW